MGTNDYAAQNEALENLYYMLDTDQPWTEFCKENPAAQILKESFFNGEYVGQKELTELAKIAKDCFADNEATKAQQDAAYEAGFEKLLAEEMALNTARKNSRFFLRQQVA